MMSRLKFGSVAVVLALALAAGVPLLHVRAAESPAGPSLEETMEDLNRAYKKLKLQITDPAKNASSLDFVSEMQRCALIGKGQIPLRAEQTPESQRAQFLMDYRQAMIGLMMELLRLETAIVQNRNDEAAQILQGLVKVKNDGHERFQEE